MKKLMVMAALIGAAMMSQASVVKWSLSGVGDYSGKSVYAFNASDQVTVLSILTAGGTGLSSLDTYSLGNTTVTGAGDRAKATATTNTKLDADKSMFFVIFDSTIADGNKFAYTTAYDVSAKVYEEGQPTPGTAALALNIDKSGQPIGANVPEPTSGLLMLIGCAALGLRRRRA